MARLSWTAEAAATVRDVYSYIARDRPETAHRTLESILNKVDSLVRYPDLGSPYRYAPSGVRVFSYGSFKVAYKLEEDGDVLVLGVFHGLIFLPPH
jgi:plasmid stabilization system protein ParE